MKSNLKNENSNKRRKFFYSLGIDIGGTNIKFAIINNYGKVIDFTEIKSESYKGRKAILKNILFGAQSLLEKYKKLNIIGIGIGTPGLVNSQGRVVAGAANLKEWNGIPLKKILEKHFKVPIFIDNDVTSLAVGEAYFGAGKGYKNVLCIALGTGLGGGIVIDKKIYRGKFGYAGEFGHIIVNSKGAKCSCGKRGCLEAYTSSWGLKRMAYELFKKNRNSLIFKMVNYKIEDITPETIFNAYKKKDKAAIEILNEMGNYLGQGLGILVNIFDPDVIIIAGGIAKSDKSLIDLIKKNIYNYTLPFFKEKVNLKISKFQNKAGAIGSATLVFEKIQK